MEARAVELCKKDVLNKLAFSQEIYQKVSEQLSAMDDQQPLPADARIVVLKILLGGQENKDNRLFFILKRPCQYLDNFETLLKDILVLPSIKPHLYNTFLQETFRKIILNAGKYHDPFPYIHQQFSRFNQLAAKLTSVTIQAEKILLESLCTIFHCPQAQWWIPLLEDISSQVDKIGEVAEAFFNLNDSQMLHSPLVQACLLRKRNLAENIKILNEIIVESEIQQLRELNNRFQTLMSHYLSLYCQKVSLTENVTSSKIWCNFVKNNQCENLINMIYFFGSLEDKNYSKAYHILIADGIMFGSAGFAFSLINLSKEPQSLDEAIAVFKSAEVVTTAEQEKNKFIKFLQTNTLDRELFNKLTTLLDIKLFGQYLLSKPDRFGMFGQHQAETTRVENTNTAVLSL